MNPEQWCQNAEQNKFQAEDQIQSSIKLRQELQTASQLAQQQTFTQQEQTDFQLRTRQYQYQKARDELVWQRNQVSFYIFL